MLSKYQQHFADIPCDFSGDKTAQVSDTNDAIVERDQNDKIPPL